MIKRIAIIGSPGSGKTTLSLILAEKTGLPVHHLDYNCWGENWVMKNGLEDITRNLASKPVWIIDGDYFNTMKVRLEAADMIIYLNFSRWLCLWRVCKRMITSYGKTRPDMPQCCAERFGWQFVKFLVFVWRYHTRKKPLILELLGKYAASKQVFVFKNNSELEFFCNHQQWN